MLKKGLFIFTSKWIMFRPEHHSIFPSLPSFLCFQIERFRPFEQLVVYVLRRGVKKQHRGKVELVDSRNMKLIFFADSSPPISHQDYWCLANVCCVERG